MKLYKFRPLANNTDLERIEEILSTGKFWFSRFWEMNDPMEGFYLRGEDVDDNLVSSIYDDKSTTVTCCFSKEEAVLDQRLWGYYANGFKGVAIKVHATSGFKCIEYEDELLTAAELNGTDPVRTILSRKRGCWEHEKEARVFRSSDSERNKSFTVGKITGVIFGASYPKTFSNPDRFGRRKKMIAYNCRVAYLKELAEAMKIRIQTARLEAGEVKIY